MNGGNAARGRADAFNIEFLDKLNQTKDCNNKSTLFEAIVKLMKDQKLAEEIPDVDHAATIERSKVSASLAAIKGEFNAIKNMYQRSKQDSHIEAFAGAFIEEAGATIATLSVKEASLNEECTELLDYFVVGQSRAKTTPEELMALFKKLSMNFKKVVQMRAMPRTAGRKIGAGADPLKGILGKIKEGGTVAQFNPVASGVQIGPQMLRSAKRTPVPKSEVPESQEDQQPDFLKVKLKKTGK